jgi:hypothetical protein
MKQCAQCGELFRPRQYNQSFCSPSCNRDFYREEHKRGVQLLRAQREAEARDGLD